MYGLYGQICFISVHSKKKIETEGIFDEFWQEQKVNYELRSMKTCSKCFQDLCIQREIFYSRRKKTQKLKAEKNDFYFLDFDF